MALRLRPSLHRRGEKAHLDSAIENQVEQCSNEKVDLWRFCVGPYKVLPLGNFIAWCIDVTATGWVPRQPPLLDFSANKSMSVCHRDLYERAK